MRNNDTLVVIPARGGSKGIPKKNIKPLLGIPLIQYSLDFVSNYISKDNICVSTDSKDIKNIVENYGYSVPFLRPAEFATDYVGTREVLLHSYNYYKSIGQSYKYILLIQPTSPIRDPKVLDEILKIKDSQENFDMIVSVKEAKSNPYFNLFEMNDDGFLVKSKKGSFVRRQDCPKVYEFNGAFYFIKIDSLMNSEIGEFEKIIKVVNNDSVFNIDIDTFEDWKNAEMLIKKYNSIKSL